MSLTPIKFKDPTIGLMINEWGCRGRKRLHSPKSLFAARFGEVVKASRIILSITQRDLSLTMDRQQASLSKIESGRREPSGLLAWQLEAALGFHHDRSWFSDFCSMNHVHQAKSARIARAESGLALLPFAQSLGVSVGEVRSIERGHRTAPLQYAWRLANITKAQDNTSWLSWASMISAIGGPVVVPSFLADRRS